MYLEAIKISYSYSLTLMLWWEQVQHSNDIQYTYITIYSKSSLIQVTLLQTGNKALPEPLISPFFNEFVSSGLNELIHYDFRYCLLCPYYEREYQFFKETKKHQIDYVNFVFEGEIYYFMKDNTLVIVYWCMRVFSVSVLSVYYHELLYH